MTIARARGASAMILCGLLMVGRTLPAFAVAQEPSDGIVSELKSAAEEHFQSHVKPFISKYCISCHSNKRPTEAGVNFSPALKDPGHAAFTELWKKAGARIKAHDMPPDYADDQPSDERRAKFAQWLTQAKYLSERDPGPFIIRRLTKTEYSNTLHDLFAVDPTIAEQLPDEVSGAGYLNSLSPLQLEHYLAIAGEVLDRVLPLDGSETLTTQLAAIGVQLKPGGISRKSARRIAKILARRAYRRPPSKEEIKVLLDVYDLGQETGLDDTQAIRLMLKSILVSPQFLFITPHRNAETDAEIVPLDDYQLAARLSYLLWATMPDGKLMKLADQGKLHQPAVLAAQVERLLSDERSRALFDGFGAQWLGLTNWQDRVFDPTKFPQMTDRLRAAMYDEARLFFESVVRDNRSIVTLVQSDYTFLNEPLATIYGLDDEVDGLEMRRVALKDRNRGGFLGMPATLAATSFPDRTSPVKRGVWVLEQILGEHVPTAPPDIPALDDQDQQSVASLTLRERTELHRDDPVCANCHRLLDPIGFGLENFDAIGRWRHNDDNGQPIDASGEMPSGQRFTTPVQLKKMVAGEAEKLARNFAEKLLAYALCRKLEGYDEIVVDQLLAKVAIDGYRTQDLVTAVVTSYPFTNRRVREELEQK